MIKLFGWKFAVANFDNGIVLRTDANIVFHNSDLNRRIIVNADESIRLAKFQIQNSTQRRYWNESLSFR